MMLDLEMDDRVEVCCMTHGQKSRNVFFKYYQWALLQRGIQKSVNAEGVPLEIFEIKRS